MFEDPIVEEIRHYRQVHASKYENNMEQIVSALRKKEQESTRKVLNPGPKKLLKETG